MKRYNERCQNIEKNDHHLLQRKSVFFIWLKNTLRFAFKRFKSFVSGFSNSPQESLAVLRNTAEIFLLYKTGYFCQCAPEKLDRFEKHCRNLSALYDGLFLSMCPCSQARPISRGLWSSSSGVNPIQIILS